MSKTKLKHASYSIKKLLDKSRLAYERHANYQQVLNLCVKHLDELGYHLDNINQLKQKHIYSLVDHWQDQCLNTATIKNRMSTIRLACKLQGKRNVISSNDHYAIGKRSYIPEKNKALQNINFKKISDPYIKMSLQLQQMFGLRREESLKIVPKLADKREYLELQPSWTKGGVPRSIPIVSQAQRIWLNRAKALCGESSLIPLNKSYIEQRNFYDRITHKAGLFNLHGLRHAYAQKRYWQLTNKMTNGHGWAAPIAGGKSKSEMKKSEIAIDQKVREIISRELGHSRREVLKIYCA
jgi:site-specific recombinase XerC